MKTMIEKNKVIKGSSPSHLSDEEIDELGWMNVTDSSDEAFSEDEVELKHQLPKNDRADTSIRDPTPLEAHYIWEGTNIPNSVFRNILYFKETNPDYVVNIWTSRPSTVQRSLMSSMECQNDAIGRHLSSKEVLQKNINVRHPSELFSSPSNTYQKNSKLESIFLREISGPFKNYAAASDVLRLLILHAYGGLYMDADVAVKGKIDPINTNAGTVIHSDDRELSNAILAALPHAEGIGRLLDTVVRNYYEEGIEQNNELMWGSKRFLSKGIRGRKIGTINTTGPGMIRDVLNEYKHHSIEYQPFDKFGHIEQHIEFFNEADNSSDVLPRHDNIHDLWQRGFRTGLDGSGAGWVGVTKKRRASLE
jgi:insecticidal toxin complex protein TccC